LVNGYASMTESASLVSVIIVTIGSFLFWLSFALVVRGLIDLMSRLFETMSGFMDDMQQAEDVDSAPPPPRYQEAFGYAPTSYMIFASQCEPVSHLRVVSMYEQTEPAQYHVTWSVTHQDQGAYDVYAAVLGKDLVKHAPGSFNTFWYATHTFECERGNDCCVCGHDELADADMLFPCGHYMHRTCWMKWIGCGKTTCPLCRRIY